ncbi:MAG TPA: tripartite tricarboxylate transporter substrate binding protein [Ramlibacter sp.]|nr:tripartite tricarboxylate transporter substrate binding protein [Ramlibacter sp.]
MARALAQQLGTQLNVPVVVENREGAGGVIGAAAVQAAEPDGNTLLFTANPPFVVQPLLQKKPGYDPVSGFTPIARVGSVSSVLVVASSSPIGSFAQLVEAVRRAPGTLNYAHSGTGTHAYLDMERIKQALQLRLVDVRYKSSAQAMQDTLAGHINVQLPSLPAALPHIKAGMLRPLAVGSARRNPALPNVPTLGEAMKDPAFESVVWYALLAPAGLKRDVAVRLQDEASKAVGTPLLAGVLERAGVEASAAPGPVLAAQIAREAEAARTLLNDLGVKPE